jgi:hypothetical protein
MSCKCAARDRGPSIFLLSTAALLALILPVLAAAATQQDLNTPPAKSAGVTKPRIETLVQSRHGMPGIGSKARNAAAAAQTRSAPATASGVNPQFLPPMQYSIGGYARTVAIADLNNDGKLDVVVNVSPCFFGYFRTCGGNGGVQVFVGNGDGTFQPPVLYNSGGYGSTSVAVSDVNHDGKNDLIVASPCDFSANCSSGVVGLLLGNGDGTFQAAVAYPSGGELTTSVAVTDVNGDGHADLLVTNCLANGNSGYGCGEGSIAVLLGNGDGTFKPGVVYDSGGVDTNSIAVADFNGDGKLDLVVASQCSPGCNSDPGTGTVGILLNKRDGTFQSVVDYSSGATYANSVTVADVNGDGNADLLVANDYLTSGVGDGIVSMLLGIGDGTFKEPVTYNSGGGGAKSVIAADVNGDGYLDLIATNLCLAPGNCSNSVVGVLLGNGDGTFQSALTFNSGVSGSLGLAAGDLNGDGRQDAVAADWLNMEVLLNDAGPHTETTTTLVSSTNPQLRNQNVTYIANVASQSGHAIGSITFYDGSSVIATVPLSNSQAAYTTSYARAGIHSIKASYPGDTANLASTSGTLTEDISAIRLRSTTTVATSGSPSLIGQTVTFTARVNWVYGAVPDGELVAFYDGPTLLASETTTGGIASFSSSALLVKTHNIKAAYAGDPTLLSSSAMVEQVVNLYPTTTTLGSAPNPSNYGKPVTLTAHVTTAGTSVATGSIVFKNGTTTLGTGTLDSTGVATLTGAKIPVGSNSLTAIYRGDTLNAKSTSGVVTQVVNQAMLIMTLASSANPSSLGQSVKVTAMLTSNGGLPTGASNIVTFASGGTTLGTATISAKGISSLPTSALPLGSNVVTATYPGNANYSSATASVTQVVH